MIDPVPESANMSMLKLSEKEGVLPKLGCCCALQLWPGKVCMLHLTSNKQEGLG